LSGKEESKITWITCPECGSKIGIVVSVGRAPAAVPEEAEAEVAPTWPPTSIRERLAAAGVDLSLVDVEEKEDVVILSPKRFLGDLWGPINDAVKGLGGTWIREGRESRWEIPKGEMG